MPAAPPTAIAQPDAQSTPQPYARVGEDGVAYAGPRSPDAPPGALNLILFGPDAAKVAISPEVAAALAAISPQDRVWTVLPIESGQNWGAASTALVRALMNDHALAIIALDRDSSHLAEQLALKSFVPVVALSSDQTLTSTNVPWIFRLPGAATPASAVRVVKSAEARSGANPGQLRDVLASGALLDGFAFLPGGEPGTASRLQAQ